MIPKRRAHLSRVASLLCSYPYGAWAVSRPPTRTLSPSLFLQALCFQPSKYSRVRHRATSSVPELLGVPCRLKTSWTPRSVNSAAAFLFALETAARSGRRSTHVLRAPARHLCGSHRDSPMFYARLDVTFVADNRTLVEPFVMGRCAGY